MRNWRQFVALATLLVGFGSGFGPGFGSGFGSGARAEPLIVYTENYPPYSFAAPDGSVVGVATQKVRQILNESGLDYSIRLLPWARTMQFAQSEQNALIYSLTWTPKREPEFDWLALLAEANFYLHARADDMRAFTPETIKSGAYIGTCVANDLGCEFFLWAGMPPENIIPINRNAIGDFQMVIAARADLYISDITVNNQLRTSHGHDPELTKPVMRLEGKTGFYLASGQQVPMAVRDAVKAAHQRLKAQALYTVISAEIVPE